MKNHSIDFTAKNPGTGYNDNTGDFKQSGKILKC